MTLATATLVAMFAVQPLALASQSPDRVVVAGSVHPAMLRAQPLGAAPSGMRMDRMILSLKVPDAARADLDRLLAEQQNPASASYHRWLTPDEFGARFGPPAARVDAAIAWLRGQGFTIDEVSPSRLAIHFSGTKEQVESAFLTRIQQVLVDGAVRHGNVTELSIPGELADVVHGVVSTNNVPRRALNTGFRPLPQPAQSKAAPDYTSGSGHYLAPGDFSAIYNVDPVYSAGIGGAGATVAIVGRCNIDLADVQQFRTSFGLPAHDPVITLNGPDPGVFDSGEETEALLDVEWSGGVAKNATVNLVVSSSTASTDGVDLSAQYIVDHNAAPVMSTSFGSCEQDMGSAENNFYANLWQQAAAQGITAFISSGDNGVAGCDSPSGNSGTKRAVNGLASTPYNVAVGGTEFNDGSGGSYWNSTNASGSNASAKGYIPELPWNESGNASGGSGLWAGSGGASTIYSRPAWQVAPGISADGMRDIPDVSLSAAQHDGYIVIQGGSWGVVGGTSASSPSFAGLMALVVQKTGQRQGNANARFYQLAAAQYGGSGPAVFHDVTSGDIGVPGVNGYTAGPGYDMATGLGSVDADAMVSNWAGSSPPANDFSVSLSPASQNLAAGNSVSFTVSTAVTNGSAQPLQLSFLQLPTGVSASFGNGASTVNLTAGQSASLNVSATTDASNGSVTFSVHAVGTNLSRDAEAVVVISGGSNDGPVGPSCPLGDLDLFGICIPLGCSSTGAPTAWLAVLCFALIGLGRRKARKA
jgi:pseudomonalisin